MPNVASDRRLGFSYQYRDAANFKAHGVVVLEGHLSPSEQAEIVSRLDGGEFFVAEQIGVPPLYDTLYEFSNGPTDADHGWHQFLNFGDIPASQEDWKLWGSSNDFLQAFRQVNQWNDTLSPHFLFR